MLGRILMHLYILTSPIHGKNASLRVSGDSDVWVTTITKSGNGSACFVLPGGIHTENREHARKSWGRHLNPSVSGIRTGGFECGYPIRFHDLAGHVQ